MNIHEYQAKHLLAQFAVPVPLGVLAQTPAEARKQAETLPGPVWMVKAQIHAGGRGKGGGVRACRSIDEVEAAARTMLGMQLITPQTGPEGKKVSKLWIEQGTEIDRELYLAVALNRGAQRLTVMVSPDGGMDIEAVAEQTPERIRTESLDASHFIWPFQARSLFMDCGLSSQQVSAAAKIVQGLVQLAVKKDAVLIEINPLAVTKAGNLLALDGKINFDESSLPRNPDVAALDDPEESDALELKARQLGVQYVRLGGFIGAMANGAGLAMATMDAIKNAGAEPANFLDVGGNADIETVASGFRIIASDPQVKGILINIFGGILRCDTVAQGVVKAALDLRKEVPLVVRLEGTNMDAGWKILAESGLRFEMASSMADAAQKVAAIARG